MVSSLHHLSDRPNQSWGGGGERGVRGWGNGGKDRGITVGCPSMGLQRSKPYQGLFLKIKTLMSFHVA